MDVGHQAHLQGWGENRKNGVRRRAQVDLEGPCSHRMEERKGNLLRRLASDRQISSTNGCGLI